MPRISASPPVLLRCLAATLLVVIASVVQVMLLPRLGIHHPFVIYYAAVAISALYLEVEGGLTATILSALSAAYLWMDPIGRLSLENTDDEIYVAVFVLEGFIISYAAKRMRDAKAAEGELKIAEERQQTAEKLQESEQRLRLALEGGKMGMWIWDVGSNRSEWNDQEYELLGLPKGNGQEPTERFFDMVHADDLERLRGVLDDVLKHRDEFVEEFRIVRPDGEVRWVAGRGRLSRDSGGRPTRMRGVNYDITAGRLAEEELRRSEREARRRADELAVLMDTVPAITFIAYDPECRCMSGSLKSRELLRVPEGKSVSVSAPEGERPETFLAIKDGRELAPEELPLQMAARGQEIRDYEMTLLFNDGTSCDICGNAVPLFDDAGKVRGAIGAFIDITARKKMERELQMTRDELEKRVEERTAELRAAMESLKRETEERLEALDALRERDQLLIHQSRLATMGEMIGNIAHQWRQPLNVMGLIVQEMPVMYRSGAFNEEYLNAQIAKAKDLIFHMSQTIEDFRNFFRPSREKVAFKAGEMITRTLTLVHDTLKNAEVTVKVEADDEAFIYGYMSECCQVLLNLLINSRDAFLTCVEPKVRVITIKASCREGKTVITIADNAGGIPETVIDKIFDPYFTTKDSDKGTGIGLFMAKNIIEKHMNGTLTVRNADGGAEFRIEVGSSQNGG